MRRGGHCWKKCDLFIGRGNENSFLDNKCLDRFSIEVDVFVFQDFSNINLDVSITKFTFFFSKLIL